MPITLPIDMDRRQFRVGNEARDVFEVDGDFDGITVTIELKTPEEAKAVAAALCEAIKPAGREFPPANCTAWEDCSHDGICHDPTLCAARGPNHAAFYGEDDG